MSETVSEAQGSPSRGKGGRYRLLVERRDITLLLMIVIASLVVSQITPYFLTVMNMRTLGLAVAFNGIAVIGMTILMIAGGIDLSVGATWGLVAVIVALAISSGVPLVPSLVLGLLVSVGIGLLNVVLVNRYQLSPFLATLGTMSILRGMIWVVSGGHSIVGLPSSFNALGQAKILGVQLPVYIMLVCVIFADFMLRRSGFLRQVYYIGINRESAVSAGIPVARVTGFAFVLSAVLAGLAGILDGARVGAVYVMAGLGLEFQIITAAVIGGTSLSGGKGTILGSLLGVILMAMLTNVLNLLAVNMYWQTVLVGVILVAVVALDRVIAPQESR